MQIVEAGAPFDVHVLGAERRAPRRADRARSSSEPANSPPSHAGRQVTTTGQAAAGQRAGDVRVADRVEPQLDQVGAGDRVAPAAQLGHRRRGHGHAQAGLVVT